MKTTITTTGRRSGERRSVTLYAWPDGERHLLVGSNGGDGDDPAWVGNLRADPHATIKVGREVRNVVAREVDGDERERLWALACEAFPMYATYQRRTARSIPLFLLEDDAGDAG